MPDAADQETEVFAKALSMPLDERAVYLTEACGSDTEMRKRLEALLQLEGSVGDFLEDSAQNPEVGALLNAANGELPARVGRYKVLEKIGEGGCGVIYLAEQSEPVRRQVALKIIKPGMGTKEVIARFEVERQALALMDHPGIAKVFDAGETETGRPYFVMELIRGIKITEYCDRNALTTEGRLKLFIQVCEAVQHAHQKGIIHRDLKPSNILVTAMPGGVAQPVIIDFGIAKATNDLRLTDKTLFTAVEMLIGTPTYMSPEQTTLASGDVDTRSDIYSLGVLLYELLTGSTPFDAGELLQLGIDEVRRAIREREPPRPSARLGRMTGDSLTGVAKHRGTEPRSLLRSVRGDLDWIVMKALEKDRTRRYETANGLALDVKRYLSSEPVSARPPSSIYRLQKAIRRNKTIFGAVAAVAIALVAGIVVSTGQMIQARNAQREAETARRNEQRLLLEAQAAERKAQAQALAASRTAYSSDMNVAAQALEENNLGRARLLLNRHRPQPGEMDLRGWEWRFLWNQARPDDHDILVAATGLPARPMSFSPDGQMLVREIEDGRTSMMVTDMISRRVVLERPNARLPVFAHRDNRVAFVAKDPPPAGETVTVLDMATRKETRLISFGNSAEWIGFTPDDRLLLVVSRRPGTNRNDGNPADLMAWEVETGRLVWQRTIEGRPPWMRWRLYAISPDGTSFAAAFPGGRVQVLEIKDGSERFTIKATEEISLSVMFSPDSATLLTGAGFNDPVIHLWDAQGGKTRGMLNGHNAYVTDFLFTPDGSRLISSGADQTIRLWNWSKQSPAGVLHGHLDEVDGIALAPSGRTLVSRCKDGSIYLWDLSKTSGHFGYKTLPGRLKIGSRFVQFTPDSRSIVGIETGGDVVVWDARTLAQARRWSGVPKSKGTGLSPDARWVVTTEFRDELSVWSVADEKKITTLNFNSSGGGLRDWEFTLGEGVLMTVSGPMNRAVLESWSVNSWQRLGSSPLPFKTVLDYTTNFAPKSFTLADTYVVMADGAYHLFDVATLKEAPQPLQPAFEPNDWAVSFDNRMMAAADSSGRIWIWEVATLRPVATLKSFLLGAHSVAYSADDRRLAAGSNGREAVKLWDVDTWQEVLTLPGEGSRFAGLKFSPDGRHLLAVNDAGVAHLWTAPTWEEIAAEETKKDAPARPAGGTTNGFAQY